MSTFDEKLETLDVPPRFVERDFIAQFRRDSNTSRLKHDPNSFFLLKRERLESGESLFLAQSTTDKRDFGLSFNLLNSCEKVERRRASFAQQPEFSLVHLEQLDVKAMEPRGLQEEESVIDQKLTIEKVETAKVSVADTEAGASDKDETPKEESRFVIKVKMTDDQRLELSHKGSYDHFDDEEDINMCMLEDMQADKGSNLIFGDEPTRLTAKIAKVTQYWAKSSLLIPNVFRNLKDFEDDKDNLLEFQDYSRKELLVQSNGTKFKSAKDRGPKKLKRGSESGSKRMSGGR